MKNVLASSVVGSNVGGYEGDVVIDGDEDLVGFMLTLGVADGSSTKYTSSMSRTSPVSLKIISQIEALFASTRRANTSAVSG